MEEGPRQKELPGAVVPGGDGLGPLEELQAGPGGLCSVRSVGEGVPACGHSGELGFYSLSNE